MNRQPVCDDLSLVAGPVHYSRQYRVDLHNEVVLGLIESRNPPSRSAASDTNKQSHHRLGPTAPTHPRIDCGGRLLLNRNDISELHNLKLIFQIAAHDVMDVPVLPTK